MRKKTYNGLIILAVMLWLFAGSEIGQRAAIELSGTIVSSETSCMQPQNNRCSTVYIIEGRDHSRLTYIAGPTDKALQRRLPTGTEILKEKWALSYSVNGQQVNDFPLIFYCGLLFIGVCCMIGWLVFRKRAT